ncbi:MAG: DinB family protein [Bacteroidetes bacterium]|nr:MAG: DinB family protein [Bacteroidota bacterium]REJ99896.1 MAG: DinB family protein [Bacteroidota bacterium]REK34269.1 MAG: DinB family protein [Bacteroidota bacterium]REK50599.1 MAG: DinB family protein [Bacteroidota bacterium]
MRRLICLGLRIKVIYSKTDRAFLLVCTVALRMYSTIYPSVKVEDIKTFLKHSLQFNLDYAAMLIECVPEESRATIPGPGLENHAAFTIGHLCTAYSLMSKYLGEKYCYDESWDALFRRKGPGDPRIPSQDNSEFPTLKSLLSEFESKTAELKLHISELEDSRFNETVQWRFSGRFPTLSGLLIFMCITHTAMHLGQLSAWRRSIGLDSALGKMS